MKGKDCADRPFNGNHRVHVAVALGLVEVRCVTSEADDALPLTVEDVLDLGGRIEPTARPAP